MPPPPPCIATAAGSTRAAGPRQVRVRTDWSSRCEREWPRLSPHETAGAFGLLLLFFELYAGAFVVVIRTRSVHI